MLLTFASREWLGNTGFTGGVCTEPKKHIKMLERQNVNIIEIIYLDICL